MADRLRALFVNEGALGTAVLGHMRVGETLEARFRDGELDPRFAVLPPMSAATRLAVRQVPGLGHADLDLQTLRWHVAQALRARRIVREKLRQRPEDVLHLHAHTIGFLLRDVMVRVPTLLSVDATVRDWHAMGIWRRTRPYSRAAIAPSLALERRVFAAAAGVLAFTGWTQRAVERACPSARVVEHHPGVDLVRFRPGPKSPDRPRVLFVGGRFAEKGGNDVLAALGPHAGRELELDLVTPAALVAAPPAVRVHRLGPDDAGLTELYRRADVFCLPTYGDAVPFSVVEAMACGAAVVATPVGAIPELIDGAGRLVPPGDPRALREAVLALAGDAAARSAHGTAGRARCEARYDAVVQGHRLVEILHDAAGR